MGFQDQGFMDFFIEPRGGHPMAAGLCELPTLEIRCRFGPAFLNLSRPVKRKLIASLDPDGLSTTELKCV
jgi:hypothetical protein